MDDQNAGPLVHAGNGDKIAKDIELEVVVAGHVPRIDRRYVEQRVAVGSGADDVLGGNVARRPCSILDQDRLVQSLGQRVADEASDQIASAAGGETNDEMNWP